MSEKVIIEDQEPEQEPEGEIIFSSAHDYIASAVQAIGAVDEMDTAIMSKADERRINRIKKQSLKLLAFYINELYDETFENPVDTDPD